MKRSDSQPSADSARIDELEARLAQQDHSILELSDEIYRQQREIAQLELKLRELGNRVTALADPTGAAQGTQDERPPHY
jgi:SlyX protein